MSNKFRPAIAVYAIALILFSILFFVAPFPKTAATIISYVFLVVSAALSAFLTFRAFDNNTEIKSKVYGFPIFKVGIITFVLQLVFTLLVFIIAFFVSVPVWVSVVVPLFIIGFGCIGAIAAESVRTETERQDEEIRTQTEKITYFRLDIENIVELCKNEELKKAVSKLAEDIRYSDPVSSDATAEMEEKISSAITDLERLVTADDSATMDKVAEIGRMLSDRNRRCKEMKG